MGFRTSVLPFFALLLAACGSNNQPIRPDGASALPSQEGGYAVYLVDEYGQALSTYRAGQSAWVEGRLGQRYAIRFDNRTYEQVEVVMTVDGRDVVSGEPGDHQRQRGYIVGPQSSVTVDGFRQSLDSVATFRFSAPGDAYSARRGTPENLGVVGVAVFPQEIPQNQPLAVPSPVYEREGAKMMEDQAAAAEAVPRLGTEYGESRQSSVVETPFVRRDSQPASILAVYYDSREGLIQRGLIQAPAIPTGPQPFPGALRFAPPP